MKMKTCFQCKRWTLLFFCLWEIFSSVAVSSTSAQKVLTGAAGESVTFSTGVPVSGSLIYKGTTVGQVFNSQAKSFREFKNRLHWNSQNGFFNISQLRTNDSGVYTVDNTEEDKKEVYELSVYDKVSAPEVKELNRSSSESEFCLLLCSVKNVKGLNLVWFKGSIILNHTNSSSPEDTLYLPLEIQQIDNEIFSCVASNPVSKQTIPVNFTKHCLHKAGTEKPKSSYMPHIPVIVCSVIFVLVVIVMVVLLRRNKRRNEISRREDPSVTEGLHEEVQYSVINHKNHAQGNICEPAPKEASQLTTIYERIRPHEPGTSFQRGSP